MGVLPCNRNGCDNIMCDRHSYKFGYICNSCFEELVNKRIPIDQFMNSKKEDIDLNPYTEEYYNNIFPATDL